MLRTSEINKIKKAVDTSIMRPLFTAAIKDHKVSLIMRHGRTNSRKEYEVVICAANLKQIKQGTEKWTDLMQWMNDNLRHANAVAFNYREHRMRVQQRELDAKHEVDAEKRIKVLKARKAPQYAMIKAGGKDTVNYRAMGEKPQVTPNKGKIVKDTWVQIKFKVSSMADHNQFVEGLAEMHGVRIKDIKDCKLAQGSIEQIDKFRESMGRNRMQVWFGATTIVKLFPELTQKEANAFLKEHGFDKEYVVKGRKRLYIHKKRRQKVVPLFGLRHLESLDWVDVDPEPMKTVTAKMNIIDKVVRDAFNGKNSALIDAEDMDVFYEGQYFSL